jgi:hypothetical protein
MSVTVHHYKVKKLQVELYVFTDAALLTMVLQPDTQVKTHLRARHGGVCL